MVRLLALLAVIVTVSCASALSGPRDHALRIIATGPEGSIVCGATSVGPDVIETASHCLGVKLASINGVPVEMVRSEQVGVDRTRVVVTGIRFDSWPRMAKPAQGERVRWWGQPMGWAFVYREGVVAFVADDGMAVDATICRGDSGSGLFNDRGELVGVVSQMTNDSGCTFMVAR